MQKSSNTFTMQLRVKSPRIPNTDFKPKATNRVIKKKAKRVTRFRNKAAGTYYSNELKKDLFGRQFSMLIFTY